MVRYGCGGRQCEIGKAQRQRSEKKWRSFVWNLVTGGREKLSLKQEMEFSEHRDGQDRKHRGQDQPDMEEKCVWRFWWCSGIAVRDGGGGGEGRAKGGGRCSVAPLLVLKKRYAPRSCPIRTHDGGQHA